VKASCGRGRRGVGRVQNHRIVPPPQEQPTSVESKLRKGFFFPKKKKKMESKWVRFFFFLNDFFNKTISMTPLFSDNYLFTKLSSYILKNIFVNPKFKNKLTVKKCHFSG
jgi:hypothetical protein